MNEWLEFFTAVFEAMPSVVGGVVVVLLVCAGIFAGNKLTGASRVKDSLDDLAASIKRSSDISDELKRQLERGMDDEKRLAEELVRASRGVDEALRILDGLEDRDGAPDRT